MTEKRKTWVEMSNGKVLDEIPFVAWTMVGKEEVRFDFTAPNPPIYHGDPNLFSRLSFESIRALLLARFGDHVGHIIQGECNENGARDCYVYRRNSRVPFAVIRPAVFVREVQS